MFIIGKIISDGETNFTQHKYNKFQNHGNNFLFKQNINFMQSIFTENSIIY